MRFAWAARTDVGKRRQLNEDSFVAEPGLFAVADGMGGHAAGEVASRLVVDRFQELASRVPVALEDVADLVERTNRAVRDHASSAGTEGMGTTLVAAILVDNGGDDAIVVVNVGDSRCYLLDEDGLRIVTHDHSRVQELIDAGDLAPELAERHPERNVVTRAIGADDRVVPDFVVLDATEWARLLLCSDGVSGQLTTEQITSAMSRSNDPDDAVHEIIELVLAGRAPDNATAVVVDVEWADDADAEIAGPSRAAAIDADITAPATPRGEVVAVDGRDDPADAALDDADPSAADAGNADLAGADPACEDAGNADRDSGDPDAANGAADAAADPDAPDRTGRFAAPAVGSEAGQEPATLPPSDSVISAVPMPAPAPVDDQPPARERPISEVPR